MEFTPPEVMAIVVSVLGFFAGLVCTLTIFSLLSAELRNHFVYMTWSWCLGGACLVLNAIMVVCIVSLPPVPTGAYVVMGVMYALLEAIIAIEMRNNHKLQARNTLRISKEREAAESALQW